jgi:hypothetical protein
MYENLQKKVMDIAEKYADMIDGKIIESAILKEAADFETKYNGLLHEITDGIRILHHAVAMLERLNRLSREDGADSKGNRED